MNPLPFAAARCALLASPRGVAAALAQGKDDSGRSTSKMEMPGMADGDAGAGQSAFASARTGRTRISFPSRTTAG